MRTGMRSMTFCKRRLGIIERRDGPNGTHIEKAVVEIGDKALLNRLELETDRFGIGNDGLRLRTRLLRPRAATRRATGRPSSCTCSLSRTSSVTMLVVNSLDNVCSTAFFSKINDARLRLRGFEPLPLLDAAEAEEVEEAAFSTASLIALSIEASTSASIAASMSLSDPLIFNDDLFDD
jgi:hypothetical protein